MWEDSFIPDDLNDKFYDDNTYNWEVMFETVKLFVMKEGGDQDGKKRTNGMWYGRWLTVSRDLARWMSNQRQKIQEKSEEGKKLNSIRFMWDKHEHEWHAMFCAVKRFKERRRWPRRTRQRTSKGSVGRWQTSAEGFGIMDQNARRTKTEER